MTEPMRNYGDHGGATAVCVVQAPQWHRAFGVTGALDTSASQIIFKDGVDQHVVDNTETLHYVHKHIHHACAYAHASGADPEREV